MNRFKVQGSRFKEDAGRARLSGSGRNLYSSVCIRNYNDYFLAYARKIFAKTPK
jgi:hypothetical protein